MFINELVIGAILVCATVLIHAIALDRLMRLLEFIGPLFFKRFRRLWKIPMLVVTVLCVLVAHIIQIWLWAFFYIGVAAVPDFETALYFSTSTFTTVGYGDVVLDKTWRLISSFQSANGFLMFGWSTAFIFEVTSKLYDRDPIRKRNK